MTVSEAGAGDGSKRGGGGGAVHARGGGSGGGGAVAWWARGPVRPPDLGHASDSPFKPSLSATERARPQGSTMDGVSRPIPLDRWWANVGQGDRGQGALEDQGKRRREEEKKRRRGFPEEEGGKGSATK